MITDNLREIELGDHICMLYDNEKAKLSTTVLFILDGLKRNELVLVLEEDKDEILRVLNEVIDAKSFIERERLIFHSKEESYLRDGFFDPDKMLETIAELDEKALTEGCKGLRIVGNASWVLTYPRLQSFLEFEAKLNRFLPLTRCICLCLIDERKFDADTLFKILQAHPKIIAEKEAQLNPNYVPPERFLKELWKNEPVQKLINRKLKREFEEVERRFRLLFESPFDAVMVIKNHKLTSCNSTALKILGFRRFRDLLSKNIFELLLEDSKEIFERKIKAANTDKPQFFELSFVKADGSQVELEVSLTRVEDGLMMIARDITERKRIEEKLRESEEKFRRAFDSAPILLAIVDRSGVFIEANKAMKMSLGRNPVGMSIFDLMDEKDAERRMRKIRQAINEKRKKTFEDSRGEGESKRYFHNILIPLDIGNETHCMIISQDITRFKCR